MEKLKAGGVAVLRPGSCSVSDANEAVVRYFKKVVVNFTEETKIETILKSFDSLQYHNTFYLHVLCSKCCFLYTAGYVILVDTLLIQYCNCNLFSVLSDFKIFTQH